ncbi:MAG: hypothetical protein J6C82_07280 [Clostridia bacterium]|nr:hypothetical protein [Clostridia bacterium]
MKNIVIDYRASADTVDALCKMGFNIIKTPRLNTVYTTICGHSDIMIHKLNENLVVTEPSVYEYFKEKLTDNTVIKGRSRLNNKYPFDIAYNAARVGEKIFCNEKFTDSVIINYANKNNINIINTKQGYSKCSICVVSDNAIITSDKNIMVAAEKNKIDVLAVDDNRIKLEGFEHGFIGGSTGLIDKNTLVFNGDINFHSDANRIIDFCNLYGVKPISLNNGPIVDIGSIIAI